MNNIAFNVIHSPSFIAMCKAISDYGCGYALPSYSTLRRRLVPDARKDVEHCFAIVKESWLNTGCTLMSNIWTDIKERSFLYVIAYSPHGAIFLNSFERSDEKKTGNLLREILILVIEEIGPDKVVQTITDNASNYGLACEIIIGRFPHICRIRSAAHGIQLLSKISILRLIG